MGKKNHRAHKAARLDLEVGQKVKITRAVRVRDHGGGPNVTTFNTSGYNGWVFEVCDFFTIYDGEVMMVRLSNSKKNLDVLIDHGEWKRVGALNFMEVI